MSSDWLIWNWFKTHIQRWAGPAALGQRYGGAFGGVESFSRTLAVWTHRCHDTLIQPSVIDCSICVWPCRRSSANQTNLSYEGGAKESNAAASQWTWPGLFFCDDLWSPAVMLPGRHPLIGWWETSIKLRHKKFKRAKCQNAVVKKRLLLKNEDVNRN